MAHHIVILAPIGADVEAAVNLMKEAGHEVEVIEPKPFALVSLAASMLQPEEAEEKTEEPSDVAAKDEATPEQSADTVVSDEESEEDLGECLVEGETVRAFAVNSDTSTLGVTNLVKEAKASFNLCESSYVFWPNNVSAPTYRAVIRRNEHIASIELPLADSPTPRLNVGRDLLSMFKAK